jgi:hypothetical protein
MPQTVKISDGEMEKVREAAELNSRSIAGQAEHWIRLGRAVERDPRFGYTRIEQVLKGLMRVEDLTDDEQEDYLDRLGDLMSVPNAEEKAFFADREARGLGVGMDEDGQLTYSPNAKH